MPALMPFSFHRALLLLYSKLYPTLYNSTDSAHQAPLSSTVSQSLLKFMSIESVMLSNHLILCCLLLLLLSIFPSTRVFSSESALRVRWPKYWSFSFSPFNEYSGLFSIRTDWFGLLAVQGTLKCLLQHLIIVIKTAGANTYKMFRKQPLTYIALFNPRNSPIRQGCLSTYDDIFIPILQIGKLWLTEIKQPGLSPVASKEKNKNLLMLTPMYQQLS